MVPNGINTMSSLPGGSRNGGGGYNFSAYPPPSRSKTSLSSFSQHHRRGSLSQSDDQDSADETDPLSRENPRYLREPPPSYPLLHGKGQTLQASRDNVDRAYEQRPCYGYDGYDSASRYRDEGSDFHHWSAGLSPSSSSSSHTGKHKRRRKRPHGEREHTMKDQATNTDLSSNGEGQCCHFSLL